MPVLTNEENEFIEDILEVLSAMGKVNSITTPGYFSLHKDEIMFGYIKNMKVFLMDNTSEFTEIPQEIVSGMLQKNKDAYCIDTFLIKATAAFWEANKRTELLQSYEKTLEEA